MENKHTFAKESVKRKISNPFIYSITFCNAATEFVTAECCAACRAVGAGVGEAVGLNSFFTCPACEPAYHQ